METAGVKEEVDWAGATEEATAAVERVEGEREVEGWEEEWEEKAVEGWAPCQVEKEGGLVDGVEVEREGWVENGEKEDEVEEKVGEEDRVEEAAQETRVAGWEQWVEVERVPLLSNQASTQSR